MPQKKPQKGDKPTIIKQSAIDDISQKALSYIATSKTFIESEIIPKDTERYQTYHASPEFYKEMFPKLSETCNVTNSAVRSTIERMTASIFKMFFGSEDVVTISGQTADDDTAASTMQELVNWQITQKNGILKVLEWIKEGLITMHGAIKVSWYEDMDYIEEDKVVSPLEMQALQQESDNPDSSYKIDHAQVIPLPTGPAFKVSHSYTKLKECYPKIENLKSSELLWSPNASNLQTAPFVCHRKNTTIDELRKNVKHKNPDGSTTGMYDPDKVEEVADKGATDTMLDTTVDNEINDLPYEAEEQLSSDDPMRQVEIDECYMSWDINGDGQAEKIIVTLCGNIVLRCEANEFEQVPIFSWSPSIDPHRIVPKSGMIDQAGQLQHLKVAVTRGLVTNIAFNNNPQVFVNSSMFQDIDQLIDGESVVELNGTPKDAYSERTITPLAPLTMSFLELIQGELEEVTGITRYNQGLDSDSLNKTATGINAIINQSNQSLELIARIFAETAFTPALKFMVFLNQKFISQPFAIRVTGKQLQINPDDIQGQFDYVVNSGMGMGTKQDNIQHMQTLLQLYQQLVPTGVANIQNVYNATKKLIEEMGIKNTDDFLASEQEIQQKIQQQQQAQAAAQQQQQPNVSESIQAKITDAPIEIQAQYWAKLGFQADIGMFARNQQQQADQQVNVDAHKQAAGALKDIISSHLKKESTHNGQIASKQGNPSGNTGAGNAGISGQQVSRNQAGNLGTGADQSTGGAGQPLPLAGDEAPRDQY